MFICFFSFIILINLTFEMMWSIYVACKYITNMNEWMLEFTWKHSFVWAFMINWFLTCLDSILNNNIVYFCRGKDGVRGVLLNHKQVSFFSLFFFSLFLLTQIPIRFMDIALYCIFIFGYSYCWHKTGQQIDKLRWLLQ